MTSLLFVLVAAIAQAGNPPAPSSPPAPAPQTAEPMPPAPVPGQVFTTTTIVKPAATDAAPPAPPAPIPANIATADELLTALQTADASIRTLQGDLTHLKRESELVGNRTQQHNGRIYFYVEPPIEGAAAPRRLVRIDFSHIIVDGARRTENRSFIFDGRWLVERQPDEKQIFKREVVPPGKQLNPLALGEGQFPIPIGQKKERIVERFESTLLPGTQDFPPPPGADAANPPPPPQWAAESYQLLLVPRKGTREFRDYREIRIWYRKSDLLPRMARTVNNDDSADEVILSLVELNKPLPPDGFDTKIPEGWTAEIREFREAGAE